MAVEVWRMRATDRARELAGHEPFRRTWVASVLALEDLDEVYVELPGAEVDNFVTAISSAGRP